MARTASRLRAAGAFAVAALALHQGRYMVGYGGHAGHALASQGHAYLGPLGALLVGVLALAVGEGLHRLARDGAGTGSGPSVRLARLWAVASAGLLAVYAAQESLEGLLAPGHPGGLAALAGHGGWAALPLALALGLALAFVARGAPLAARALSAASARAPRAPMPRAPRALRPRPAHPRPHTRIALAGVWAGRAPPRAS